RGDKRCGAEPDVGPCKAAFQHWYYNRETTSCQPFIYGGCSGNKNNYVSKESCTAACTVVERLTANPETTPPRLVTGRCWTRATVPDSVRCCKFPIFKPFKVLSRSVASG
uniref:BPTI/Kunitz inhibitor domain-containing protein n=1 Tax=Mola mola TaxID=94237 RepID=A0A3Q3WK23_MOLML